ELLHGVTHEEEVLLLLVQPLLELLLRVAIAHLVRELHQQVPARVVRQLGDEQRMEVVRQVRVAFDDMLDPLRFRPDQDRLLGRGARIATQRADLLFQPLLVLLLLVAVLLHLLHHQRGLRVGAHPLEDLVVQFHARPLESEALVQEVDHSRNVRSGKLLHRRLLRPRMRIGSLGGARTLSLVRVPPSPTQGASMTRFAILILATSLAAGAPFDGSKKGAASMKAPKPDPALVQAFGSSVGTWMCSGTTNMPKDMGGGQLKTKSKMTIRREAGGFAYSGDYTMAPNKAFPGMRGRMMWT